jgi:hypothetical protein
MTTRKPKASKPKPMSALQRFYVQQYDTRPLPRGVEMTLFVKASGDTVGVVYVKATGGFELRRNGSNLGVFDSLLEVYRTLDHLGE